LTCFTNAYEPRLIAQRSEWNSRSVVELSKKLDELKPGSVDESGEDGHGEVEHMPGHQDKDRKDDPHPRNASRQHTCYLVDDLGDDGAGEGKGEEPGVTENVPQKVHDAVGGIGAQTDLSAYARGRPATHDEYEKRSRGKKDEEDLVGRTAYVVERPVEEVTVDR